MSFSKRLKEAIDAKKTSQAKLAKACGISPQAISNIIRGVNKGTTIIVAEKMATFLDVRLEWLMNGSQPMIAESLIPSQHIVAIDNGGHEETHQNIRRYDVRLSAGNGNADWVVRENDDDPIFFRKGWFKARSLNPETLRGMYVRGDSMTPFLQNNDTVIIDIADTEINDGETYAVIFKDMFYVKELREFDGEVRIISKNAEYELMQTNRTEREDFNNYFSVLGHVVWRGG